jgi:hypothetical protein
MASKVIEVGGDCVGVGQNAALLRVTVPKKYHPIE